MSNPREGTIALIDKVWREKYRYTGPDGVSHEHTIEDSFARVVDGVYKHDPGHKTTALALMNGRIWSPAGRIHAGSGTPKNVTMINCFVMRTIPDSLDGIMEALTESALTSQQGGGIGLDFSTIRPRGAIVRRTESVSSGVIPFMRMWNAMCGTIMSSGSRRGAMMAVLRCDHPDIIEFVTAKHTAGELTNFNISVAVTDAFMQAVMDDNLWDLGFTVPPADPNMCVDTVAFPNNQTWLTVRPFLRRFRRNVAKPCVQR
jgi:ribonucleoside-diphosphate reductase alpha chain